MLGNDTDPEGNPLARPSWSQPAHGTVTLNADGSFTYTPDAGFTGTDSFTYKDNDGVNNSNTATVSLTVNPAVSQPPVANNDTYTATENTTLTVAAPGVLANDTAPQGQALTSQITTQPAHGTVTLNDNGSFNYTPTAGYTGPDSFTYTDQDTAGLGSRPATVSLTVNPAASQPPLANNDTYSLTQNTTLTVPGPGVQANDSDPLGLALTSTIIGQPAHGTVTLNADGSFSYTPTANFTGIDTFTYSDRDPGGLSSNVATVTLQVGSVTQPPFQPPEVGVVANLSNIFPGRQQLMDLTLLGKLELIGSNLTGTMAGMLTQQEAFVQGLYRQLLGREPDLPGLANWLILLQSGMLRQTVVDAIWQSPEHLGDEVDHLYATILNRPADSGGRAGWVNALQNGASLTDMTFQFFTAAEFQAAHPSSASFVSALYTSLLGRSAAPADLTYWTNALQNGASRERDPSPGRLH